MTDRNEFDNPADYYSPDQPLMSIEDRIRQVQQHLAVHYSQFPFVWKYKGDDAERQIILIGPGSGVPDITKQYANRLDAENRKMTADKLGMNDREYDELQKALECFKQSPVFMEECFSIKAAELRAISIHPDVAPSRRGRHLVAGDSKRDRYSKPSKHKGF